MNVYINNTSNIKTETTKSSITKEHFTFIYEKYYKNIYNYICFQINNHNDVEDLVSTVFLKVIRSFHTYNSKKSPIEAWLIGIAKNVVNDYLQSIKKKSSTNNIDDFVFLKSNNKEPEEVILINEENKSLMKAMVHLKERDRQIISMKFGTNLKNTEITTVLGISKSSVGVSIYRSLKKLKKFINKEGDFFE